jgi:predicted alpha-1,2-mannosidase
MPAQNKLTSYVDPMIGTGGHGHTYPGASLPFGMVQLSPDTDIKDWDWCSGYHYSDNSIMGFSHTHLSGTGCADYGDVLLMPTTGELKTVPGDKNNPGSGYRSRFSHKNEVAKAGYYSVLLDDYNVKAELTVTRRTGLHKYTFPKTDKANILLDLVHGIQDKTTEAEIKIIDDKTIEGYRRSLGWGDHKVYFRAEFSKPFKSFGLVEDGTVNPNKKEANGTGIKAYVNYETAKGEAILVKVGISHASLEGARKNLKEELPGWDFDAVRKQADAEWEKELSGIKVEDKNKEHKTIFYSALYHSLLNPNTFSDVDGSYMGMDGKVRNADHDVYTVFSLWDTFRGEHPLFTIIDRKRALDMVKTLILKYEEKGVLPVWELAAWETGTMIGYHSVSVIADAYMNGIRGFDAEKAYEAMKHSGMQDKLGLNYYKQMGYIPAELESQAVSKTLEYAYDDWCIAQMAKALGKEDDYNYFIARAKNYANVFDPSISLMRPKKNGVWLEPFDPYAVSGHYTEANAWQYSFFAPQDVNGLMDLMGGDKAFAAKLDELFTTDSKLTGHFQSDITGLIGQYAHGNEPSHHAAYLSNFAGEPWKTQQRVYETLTTLYTSKPDGLSGNEDCGQMSAWYVLSAMGFYSVTPGDDKFIIGTPLFETVTITEEGKPFTVKANNLSQKNYYIQSAKLNGKDYPYSYIKRDEILKGGELVFEMGPKSSKWGSAPEHRPVSKIDISYVPIPVLTTGEKAFKESTTVSLSSPFNAEAIYYTLDGSDPRVSKNKYTTPLVITSDTELKAAAFKNGTFSPVVEASFIKAIPGRTIKLNTQYSPNYAGGGAFGLIDGVRGTENFHSETWQGYEGDDLEAVIDLGSVQKLTMINASFLQNVPSWIFYPASIQYFVSTDGNDYKEVYNAANVPAKDGPLEGIKEYEAKLDGVETRYIKVIARNVGICPEWHVGAGGKAWLFVDEIAIQ